MAYFARNLGRSKRRRCSELPGGRTVCAALVGLLFLTFTASAMAWRPPTRSERAAIARSATSFFQMSNPGRKLAVSAIHVSTVGPWATVVVTANFAPPRSLTDMLQKVHGKWINRASAVNGAIPSPIPGIQATGDVTWCGVMPRKDGQDLGLPPVGKCK
jgi:hypothetical protein